MNAIEARELAKNKGIDQAIEELYKKIKDRAWRGYTCYETEYTEEGLYKLPDKIKETLEKDEYKLQLSESKNPYYIIIWE